MNIATWNKLQVLVESALQMPPENRACFFQEVCPDSTARHLAQSLVASYEQAGSFLETPATDGEIPHFPQEESLVGQRVGQYEILSEIGKGGMGAVYRARRADREFDQEVAIKFVRDAAQSTFSIARFKTERQILASLNHPNIARLFDGGTSANGTPYLVMELVNGRQIDQHCVSAGLKTSEIIQLFRVVCSAVQYAHRHLIVHRDIKPNNILLTADGVPKLLDFGIAKILDPEFQGAELAQTTPMLRLLTPEYASPEQMRGESITTASDVYSLGVVLYLLLTGQHPFSKASISHHDVIRAVCDTDPAKPSAVAQTGSRHLRGDLDTIVLKAIHKDPQRRYESVEQFSEDLRRHLEGLPIVARPDSPLYRARKFVRRHLTGVAAVCCVVLSLLAGMLATVREAQVANVQRQRAERRFNDVRKLANSLFDIHDAIQTLPGATPARKLVVSDALHYLDSLAHDAEGDSSLERELASGYYRLGVVQGNPSGNNLGDQNGALTSFLKSLALRERVAQANPNNIDDQIDLGGAQRFVSVLLSVSGKAGAVEHLNLARSIHEQLARRIPNNRRARRELGRDYETLASTEDSHGRWHKAVDYYRADYHLAEMEFQADPNDRRGSRGLAIAAKLLGGALTKVGSRDEGLRYIEESLRRYEALATDPHDAQAARELTVVKASQADIFMARGQYDRALAISRQTLKQTQSLLRADPENALLRMDLAGGYLALGTELGALGQTTQSLALLERAIQALEREIKSSQDYADLPYLLSYAYQARGDVLYHNGNRSAALSDYRRAETELEKQTVLPDYADEAVDVAGVIVKMANAFARAGQLVEAASQYQRAGHLAQPLFDQENLSAGQPLAESYTGSAKLRERQGSLSEACAFYERSAKVWQQTPDAGVPDVSGLLTGNAPEAARALRNCLAYTKRAAEGASIP